MATAERVLEFWFGTLDAHGLPDPGISRRWFDAGPAFDQEIRERFGALAARALAGRLEAWQETPRELLALVILLDQFTRNLFRGDPRAFAGDERALALARDAVDARWDRRLLPIERSFLYLPFEHSEDLAEQRRSISLFAQLIAEAPPEGESRFRDGLAWAERHLATIERFGRFPARNAALGRATTPEEEAFLAEHPSGF